MEYLDFSSVITTIRKYINDERTVIDKFLKEEVKIDQLHLMDQVFSSFCDDEEALDFTFDNWQVCRWFNGQARISPRIISFYVSAVQCGNGCYAKSFFGSAYRYSGQAACKLAEAV